LPTPVEHLRVAEQILTLVHLPDPVRRWLGEDARVRGAYFFGHIAPDVQVVSRQPRETTHFFSIPPGQHPGYVRMLDIYPWMAQPDQLSAVQSAFLLGYRSHLLLDEFWVREIFWPIFGREQRWGDWRERLLLHNVLRAWLDRRDLPHLPDAISGTLRRAEPQRWLPFATDANLRRWRDLVADQFGSDTHIRTVEIFSQRARIPDTEFQRLLEPDVMDKRVFSRVALARIDRFQQEALSRIADLTVSYLNGCARGESG
jgi:hypothetical protein